MRMFDRAGIMYRYVGHPGSSSSSSNSFGDHAVSFLMEQDHSCSWSDIISFSKLGEANDLCSRWNDLYTSIWMEHRLRRSIHELAAKAKQVKILRCEERIREAGRKLLEIGLQLADGQQAEHYWLASQARDQRAEIKAADLLRRQIHAEKRPSVLVGWGEAYRGVLAKFPPDERYEMLPRWGHAPRPRLARLEPLVAMAKRHP